MTEFAQEFVETFASYHRQNYGGCKVGVADVIIGAAASMAEYNGCPKASHIKDKLVEMVFLAETMHCCSLACSAMGHKTEAGSYYVDTLLANTVKLNCTKTMYEISRLAHDIAGGFIATLPYEADYRSEIGHAYIDKYFAGDARFPTEERLRMARFSARPTGSRRRILPRSWQRSRLTTNPWFILAFYREPGLPNLSPFIRGGQVHLTAYVDWIQVLWRLQSKL